MAAAPSPSPALSNSSSGATRPTTTAAADAPTVAPLHPVHRTGTPPKTLRGLNKPKCKQCGNVARSSEWGLYIGEAVRCQNDSSRCSDGVHTSHARVAAQKLKIHVIFMVGSCLGLGILTYPFGLVCHFRLSGTVFVVLKTNATFPDKAQTSNSPLFDHQSTEASPSGNSHRVASFRQLSNNFAQFNNLHIPLRSKKPLTRKDAVAINEWRFSKLKEYKERNIEVENEAFDRYMQNVTLLEEVFSVKSITEESIGDGSSISNYDTTSTMEDETEAMVSGLKLKLRSNPMRTNNFRKRIQQVVDEGLKKLQKREFDDGGKKSSGPNGLDKGPQKEETWWAERASALGDLIDKLNKARNEEDLKACLELKSQLFSEHKLTSRSESEDADITKKQTEKNDPDPRKEWNCLFPKVISTTEIDQETLKSVDAHFSTLEQIEGL
ncbi:hypothetical protein C1H46_038226 [Malus baccata]|uniref:Uncharacterized protein n=1 Tax=Malus baccata TaxID=106549 RepID=A0A540KPY6_MALBA|nr:hypothetical protein C1H46_038226 [Malus baccata]